jgi:hypothetical protein
MRYKTNQLSRYSSRDARERAAFLETARRAIPVNVYLSMLNHAVLTGDLPVVDTQTGQLTNTTEKISSDQRLELARYLINKALPDLQRIEPTADDGLKDATATNISLDDIATLPSDSLKALIEAQRVLSAVPAQP